MQELYNCKRIDETHYKITKFDKHLNPKGGANGPSSYVVSEQGCDCPQGSARSCRHRKMLPFFVEHDYVDTEYFFVWNTHQWYKPTGIFAQAREANGKKEPPKAHNEALDVNEFVETMQAVGIPTVVIDSVSAFEKATNDLSRLVGFDVTDDDARPMGVPAYGPGIIDPTDVNPPLLHPNEGAQKAASEAPSPPPSTKPAYRRF